MTKNVKGVITVIVVAAAVFAVWFFTRHTAKLYAMQIIKLNGSSGSLPVLMSFDEGFLKAWAQALKKGENEFQYNGARYNSKGGKKII